MPPVAGQPATVFYLLKNSPHDQARNQLTLDPATGIVSRHDRYSDKSLKAQLLTSIGIDPRRRPETLTIQEFARLAATLTETRGQGLRARGQA